MRVFTRALLGGIVLSAPVCTPVLAQGVPEAPDKQAVPKSQAASTEAASGDIIVTANKRNERELDVAGAIKAFSGDQLLAQGLTSIKDYATLTPGLSIGTAFGTGSVVIRGVSTGADTGSLAGIVVNGAQIGSSLTNTTSAGDALDLDPIDLQRVEVLKGPQGTLYGANTLSGLVSYTLRDPDLRRPSVIARGELNGTENGGTNWSIRGAASVPLVDGKAAVRLSGFEDNRAGFVDNNVRGLSNQNGGKKWGVSGSLLALPTDRMRVMLSGFYQRTDIVLDRVIYNPATHQPRDGDLQYNDFILPTYKNRIRAVIGTLNYDLGGAELTSISAYQKTRSSAGLNGTNGRIAAILPVLGRIGGVPVPIPSGTKLDGITDVSKFTQEVRLTSSGDGLLKWILGGYYAHEDTDYISAVNRTTVTGMALPRLAPALAFAFPLRYREYAGFANATYSLSRAFDVTGGIRVGRINETYQQNFYGSDAAAYNLLLSSSGLSPTPTTTPTSQANKTVVTYLATARYYFSDDGMVFARFATGFRPGGPNLIAIGLPPAYRPDTTQNYEGGLKTKFWGGKGTFDVTGYYTRWRDIIVTVSAAGLNGFGNGGNARIYGVESSLTLRPVTSLTLTGTMAYSNGRITKVNPSAAGAAGVGNILPYNPRWSGSVLADYHFPTGATWQGVLGGTARFVDKRHSSLKSNLQIPDYVLPSYSLFDVHVGLQSEKLDIDLFLRNLTNKRAQLGAFTAYGLTEVNIQRPRTLGAAVTVRY